MNVDWRSFCKAGPFVASDSGVNVGLQDGRRHRVQVRDEGDSLELSAVVLTKVGAAAVDDVVTRIWLKNRMTDIVGFRFDARGRLIGEAWIPKAGITPDEFRTCVHAVATVCDRLEFHLSGRDIF